MMAALKNKRFLVFGAAALICLLLLLLGLMLGARHAVALMTQRRAADQKRSELEAAVRGVNIDKLREENRALVGELGEIERSLPQAEYMPTLIRQIETTAALTGNDIIELRPGEIRRGKRAGGTPEGAEKEGEQKTQGGGQPAGGGEAAAEPAATEGGQSYDEMDIEIRFEGSYAGAFDFIKQLGKLGKIIAVERVEIERAGPERIRPDGRAATTVRLACKAYILAPRTGFPGELSIRVY